MRMRARSTAEGSKPTRSRWRGVGPLAVVPVAVAGLVAACGGGGSQDSASSSSNITGSSSNSSSAQSSARQSGLLYASCMRSHGMSNFPDSAVSVSNGNVEFNIPLSVKSEPQFASASRACSRDLPGGGASAKPSENVQQELEFAKCMRADGITDFPDPLPGGGFNIPGNTNTPQFEAAENACQASTGSSAGAHAGSNGS